MPGKKRKIAIESRPGALYQGIEVSREEFKAGEELGKKKLNWFERYCKKAFKIAPGLGKKAKFKEEFKEKIEFMDWNITAQELSAAGQLTMLISIIISFFLGITTYLIAGNLIMGFLSGMEIITPFITTLPFLLIAVYFSWFIQNYPITAANKEKINALTYVPEIIGYLIMSMKLVPNLEKAVEFAAEHGRGKVASDLRKMQWQLNIGVFSSMSEALDDLAYKWGKYSEEFKIALMMIRESVLEAEEAKRTEILDKVMENVLESIREKMEDFARGLTQPSMSLFYIGILMPLILVIVLPVGSIFSGQGFATPGILILTYNIIIPLIAFLFARNTIKSRPPAYEAPFIKDKFPGLPKKNKMRIKNIQLDIRLIIIIILITGIIGSYFLSTNFDVSLESALIKEGMWNYELKKPTKEFTTMKPLDALVFKIKNNISRQYLITGILLTLAIIISIYLYYKNTYKRKIQKQIMQMETEFKDSVYVLASRLGEGKPIEKALKSTQEFLPKQKTSQLIFGKTLENISVLGLPLEQAVFDPVYGSMKNIPSNMIKSSMHILVDSVRLGVNVASKTLIALSMQLRNSENIKRLLSTLIQDISGMMTTMTQFIAPIVLGITVVLEKVVIVTMASIVASQTFQQLQETDLSSAVGAELGGFGGANAGGAAGLVQAKAFETIVTPEMFLIIVCIYVIQMVIIMTYFTTKVQEENNLLVKLNIAKALPIAVLIFIIVVLVADFFIGSSLGGMV